MGQTQRIELSIGNLRRYALLRKPRNYSKPCALLIMLHGAGGTAAWTLDETELDKFADEKDIVLQTAVAESSRRQEQNAQMSEILKAEVIRNKEISKKLEDTRAEEINQRIAAQTFKSTNERLEVQLREMAKDMERTKSGGSSALTQVNKASKNPPPDNIEGMVKVADASGLIKISIGSDAGLIKGHTLEVFRLSSVATQSKYLGTVRILEVTPNEAVAQPVKPLSDKPIAGDRVASRILGS